MISLENAEKISILREELAEAMQRKGVHYRDLGDILAGRWGISEYSASEYVRKLTQVGDILHSVVVAWDFGPATSGPRKLGIHERRIPDICALLGVDIEYEEGGFFDKLITLQPKYQPTESDLKPLG